MEEVDPLLPFKIATDPAFMADLYKLPPELQRQMQNLEKEATKGRVSFIPKFQKLVKKYPTIPKVKNLLSALYSSAGWEKKAIELNEQIVAEHPDYLFGQLNQANIYYQNGEPERMTEILGETLELQALYPQRDTFYIGEVLAFLRTSIFYLGSTGRLEEAQERLNLMEELMPDSADTYAASDFLFARRMDLMTERYEKEKAAIIAPEEMGKPLPPQTKAAPKLTHPEVAALYNMGWDISEAQLQALLGLPRTTLIADLEKLLKDAMQRFRYFEKIEDEKGLGNGANFPLHALLLLGELKATESLPAILEFLRYKDEFIEFWLSDALTELVWQVLYKITAVQPEKLMAFVLEPGPATYCKSPMSQALSQMAVQQPELRTKILEMYRHILNTFAEAKPGDNLLNSELVAFLICDLMNMLALELLPEIKKLFKQGYVSTGIAGKFEEIEEELEAGEHRIYEVWNLQTQYAWFEVGDESWEPEKTNDWDDGPEYTYTGEPLVNPKKIGRNDPCPCGSGKKYKKCCG